MLNGYIQIVSVFLALMSLMFVVTLVIQYRQLNLKNMDVVYKYFRIQNILIVVMYAASFMVFVNSYAFQRKILLLFIGELALLFITNWLIEQFFMKSLLPMWTVSQYLLVISFIIMARLDIDLGIKQLYLAAGAYGIAFIVAYVYHRLGFIKYIGLPAIAVAVALLLMTNSTINGANNWMIIGDFSFQPSEIVKVLYIFFLASCFALFSKDKFRTIVVAGMFAVTLIFIQVFQNDLGSALIYYVVFILMCYVYTTNRMYIIGGGVVTLVAGYFAWLEFSHVKVRIEAWLNPWADIDNKGYQIAQSLFAIGNGGLTGSGLTLGEPNKIPVVTTDFIYSAILEEMGLIVGICIIVIIVMFFLFGIQMIEKTRSEFDFLLGSGLLIVYAFQSFLIIGGVTRAVPLTGVTLPFVSYGGTSLITTFILMGLLQGIKLSVKKHKVAHKKQSTAKNNHRHEKRADR